MLRWALESSPPAVVVRLTGLLDLPGAVEVRTALHKALTAQPSAIAVDLAEVTVHDAKLLTVFTAFAHTAAAWPGCAVLLYCPDPSVEAALHRSVVQRQVAVYRDRTEALIAAELLPAPRRFDERLGSGLDAIARARQIVAAACRAWDLPQIVDDAELAATEMVSNAVGHGTGDVCLSVSRGRYFLHLAVHDGSPVRPLRRHPDPCDDGGRGLMILDAVTSGWGSTLTAPGKVVWATIRLPQALP